MAAMVTSGKAGEQVQLGFLLRRSTARCTISSLPLPPRGGRLPPHPPKTRTPLRFPGQGGGTGFGKAGAVGSGRQVVA